ncbi:MAG: hypothetical protein D6798_14010, partial [Deltaproteobacteria bacterium]
PVVGSAELAVAAVVVTRLIELVPWTLLLGWGLWWGLWWRLPALGIAAASFAVLFSGILAASLVLARRRARPGRPRPTSAGWGTWRLPEPVERVVGRLRRAFALVGRDRRRLLLSFVLSLPFSLVNCLAVHVIMRGHGLTLSYLDTLALIPTIDTVLALPITIGGLGIREGLFVHALEPFGATRAAAVSIGLTRWFSELTRAAVGGLVFLGRGLARRR